MVEGKILMLREKPRIALSCPENEFRAFCFNVAVHRNFEILVLAVISLNTVVMSFKTIG